MMAIRSNAAYRQGLTSWSNPFKLAMSSKRFVPKFGSFPILHNKSSLCLRWWTRQHFSALSKWERWEKSKCLPQKFLQYITRGTAQWPKALLFSWFCWRNGHTGTGIVTVHYNDYCWVLVCLPLVHGLRPWVSFMPPSICVHLVVLIGENLARLCLKESKGEWEIIVDTSTVR